jgi:hypothetical protein
MDITDGNRSRQSVSVNMYTNRLALPKKQSKDFSPLMNANVPLIIQKELANISVN